MSRIQVLAGAAKSAAKFVGSKWPWAIAGTAGAGAYGASRLIDNARQNGAEPGFSGLLQYYMEGARSIGARTGWEVLKEKFYAGLEFLGTVIADITQGKHGVGLANWARVGQGLPAGEWAAGKGISPSNSNDGNILTNNSATLKTVGVIGAGAATTYAGYRFLKGRNGSGGPGGNGPSGNGGGSDIDAARRAGQLELRLGDVPTAKSGNWFSRTLGKAGNVLGGLGNSRIGKLALVGGLGTAVGFSASSAEASTGDVTTTTAEAVSADPSLIENIGNGAHAFAHGFVDESLNTGTWLAGNVADLFDNVSGGALSLVGIDTGWRERNISADWQAATDNTAENLLGAPDLSTGFARAMHGTGKVSSWFVGPAAVGFVKLGGAAARGTTQLASKFGAAAEGAGTQFAAGTARHLGASLDMFAPAPS